MGVTPRAGLPYPEAADPDMPRVDIQELATAADGAFAMYDQGPVSAIPASSPGSPGKEGRLYYATDQGILYQDYGTGWMALAPDTPFVMGDPPAGTREGQRVIMSMGSGDTDQAFEFVMSGGSGLWHAIGGPPLVTLGPTSPAQPFTSTNWATITETDHEMPIPWPGRYRVRASFGALAVGVAQFVFISFAIVKTGADDVSYDTRSDFAWVGPTSQVTLELEGEFYFASDVERLKLAAHNGSAGNTVNVVRPRIELTPLTLDAP